mmetsp:Transcript_123724/g.309237  ORF Transcript_123724/g.309237 Transcript_123724/m.309237 type:complete len:233 (-) Transcript_123724:1003-1701(-)
MRPIEVTCHTVLHEARVLRAILVVGLQGDPQHLLHLVRNQGRHVVAIGDRGHRGVCGAGVLNAVLQAACSMHHRHSTVGESDHLRDTAGLVARGHDQEVTTCHHEPLYLGVEPCISAHPALVLLLQSLEPIRQVLVTVPHEDHLHATGDTIAFVLQHPIYHTILQDVDTLLRREPTNESHQGHILILVQAEALLEGLLACRLSRQVLHGEVCSYGGVGRRVPCVLDAILYAC